MLHVNKTVEIASHSLCIFSIVLVVSISKWKYILLRTNRALAAKKKKISFKRIYFVDIFTQDA
jgi:hypothetical protein